MEDVKREAEATLDASVSAAVEELLTEADQALVNKHRRTFIGSFYHALDSKGRLVVPQSFRELLGETFCIAPSYDFKAIALYPELQYARMRESYEELVRVHRKPELKLYLEQMDAFSYRAQECDGQGRVLLPTRIRQVILQDEKEVGVSGTGDHVRIAPRPAFDGRLTSFLETLPDTLDLIGDLTI